MHLLTMTKAYFCTASVQIESDPERGFTVWRPCSKLAVACLSNGAMGRGPQVTLCPEHAERLANELLAVVAAGRGPTIIKNEDHRHDAANLS